MLTKGGRVAAICSRLLWIGWGRCIRVCGRARVQLWHVRINHINNLRLLLLLNRAVVGLHVIKGLLLMLLRWHVVAGGLCLLKVILIVWWQLWLSARDARPPRIWPRMSAGLSAPFCCRDWSRSSHVLCIQSSWLRTCRLMRRWDSPQTLNSPDWSDCLDCLLTLRIPIQPWIWQPVCCRHKSRSLASLTTFKLKQFKVQIFDGFFFQIYFSYLIIDCWFDDLVK